MNVKLFLSAITKFLMGVLLVGVLLFLPAWSLSFDRGWLLMGVLFIPMFLAGIVMMWKNPDLLRRRLDAKEKQKEQGIVIKLSGLMFVAGFVLAGLDYRFQWWQLPPVYSYIASGIFLASYVMWAVVLKQNSYLSRTIKVEEGQKVVDKGLYGVVRHPMYTATIFLFLSMPLVLGSMAAFFVFLIYPVLIVVRIIYEEKVLEKELDGYVEYKKKVRYRLIPFIW